MSAQDDSRERRMIAVTAGDGDYVVRGGREILRCAQDDKPCAQRMTVVSVGGGGFVVRGGREILRCAQDDRCALRM